MRMQWFLAKVTTRDGTRMVTKSLRVFTRCSIDAQITALNNTVNLPEGFRVYAEPIK